jgi:hypothetical protein
MSYFTDPMAAIEEAQFLANASQQKMFVVETEPNRIEVLTPEEAYHVDGLIIEKIAPVLEKEETVYDYSVSMRRSENRRPPLPRQCV